MQLADKLDDIALLLEQVGDAHWATWLRQDAVTLRNGDLNGAKHFLDAFGGMGSINDRYGFSAPKKKEAELSDDQKISRRLDDAWSIANALVRRRG